MPRPRTAARRALRARAAAAAATAVVALVASGCASSPGTVPPRGVDELVVPTPTPDPDDFGTRVDNPWFPLDPGSEQRWGRSGVSGGGLRVEVLPEPRTVAGVETTAVRTTDIPATSVVTDYYAQDDEGNVWWFGHDGSAEQWEAGVAGARAGLVVTADPRTGDGYRMALLDGVVEDTAEVLAVEDDVLEIERTTETGTETVVHRRGVGPVRVESARGVTELVEGLVATDPA